MIVRALGLFLLACAAYLGYWFVEAQTFATGLWGGCALVCGLGLILHARWAANLWYALALFASASWTWAVVGVMRSGWPYSDALTSAISLIPGLCILMISGFGSIAVAKQFRRSSPAASSER